MFKVWNVLFYGNYYDVSLDSSVSKVTGKAPGGDKDYFPHYLIQTDSVFYPVSISSASEIFLGWSGRSLKVAIHLSLVSSLIIHDFSITEPTQIPVMVAWSRGITLLHLGVHWSHVLFCIRIYEIRCRSYHRDWFYGKLPCTMPVSV